jgi:hypothetical protein
MHVRFDVFKSAVLANESRDNSNAAEQQPSVLSPNVMSRSAGCTYTILKSNNLLSVSVSVILCFVILFIFGHGIPIIR